MHKAMKEKPAILQSTEKYKLFFDLQTTLRASDYGETIFLYLTAIDQKISALLTHVSIMLAMTAIFYSEALPAWKLVIGGEMVAYILIAIGCLTCVNIRSPKKSVHTSIDAQKEALEIVCYRLKVYKVCWFSTIFVTICLLVTFSGHLFIS